MILQIPTSSSNKENPIQCLHYHKRTFHHDQQLPEVQP